MIEVIIVTKKGFMKRIPLDWVRVMGRTAKGLRIIKLYDNDEVVTAVLNEASPLDKFKPESSEREPNPKPDEVPMEEKSVSEEN